MMEKFAQTFDTSFSIIVDTLTIERDECMLCDIGNETGPLVHAVYKFSTCQFDKIISQSNC